MTRINLSSTAYLDLDIEDDLESMLSLSLEEAEALSKGIPETFEDDET